MYPAEFEYFAPHTLDEALTLLDRHGDDAKVLAGGQSLIPMMKLRIVGPRCLVDINGIDSLRGLREDGGWLRMGALCRHAEVVASPLVASRVPLMLDSASQTADVQVRNRGTVGGSLAHADPAGDWPTALLALDTTVTIAGATGRRMLPLEQFLVDAYTTALGPGELLAEVAVRLPEARSGGAYVKFEKRAGDFAVASVGVQLGLDGAGACSQVAISLGAVGAMPMRARAAEARLTGRVPSDALVSEAAALVRDAAQPFDDTRGSADYKRHLAGVLFGRAFGVALARARGEHVATLHV